VKVIFSAEQLAHNPRQFLSSGAAAPNPEQPARAEVLLEAALDSGLTAEAPEDTGDAVIAAVHTPEYLHFLQNIYTRWSRIDGASEEVLPNVHPINRTDGYPKSAVGQVGFHVYDSSCPIVAETWHSSRWSALAAAHAALQVQNGDDACYALARPAR
jgi:acetoin utilization deacetylase AcuC-like enzyme